MGCLIIIAMIFGILYWIGLDLNLVSDFISGIWSGIWGTFNAVFLWFLGIFRNFFSVFGFIGDIFEWLLINLGKLLEPVFAIVPDSPIVPFVAFAILGMLFMVLKKPGDDLKSENFDTYLKRLYACCGAAINLGMIVAGTGNPLGSISGIIMSNASKPPMTLANYAEWTDFARNMLTICVFFGLFASIAFGKTKGLRSFIRTWVGLGFCGMLGYEYMTIRLPVSHWLVDNLSFIGKLIIFPIGLFEFFVIMQWFLGIIAFVVPLSVFRAANKVSESNAANRTPTESSDSFDALGNTPGEAYPTYVSDDNGNNYPASIDGDFLYIELPGGRISTKWEYVKGQPYFNLNGKRYYPH